MTDPPLPPLVLWTARLCIVAYLLRVTGDVAGTGWGPRGSRLFWTLGAVAVLLHSAAAFLLMHHGSHVAAFEHTRQRTLELTGWNSGLGLWLNYLVLFWWPYDALRWWLDFRWPASRSSRVFQWILAFIIVNATIVFGPPVWWWVAAACSLVWGLLAARRVLVHRI